jgi:hypothetical protein
MTPDSARGSAATSAAGSLLLATVAAFLLGACSPLDTEEVREASLAVEIPPSTESLRIELPAGRLTLRQGEPGRLLVDGVIVVAGRDQASASAAADRSALRVELAEDENPRADRGDASEGAGLREEVRGRRAILSLDAPARARPRAEIRVTIPPGLDLDVSISAGELFAELAGPPRRIRIDLAVGNARLRLPASTSASITAGAQAGSVEVEGFRNVGSASQPHLAGATYIGTIGAPEESASVQIEAHTGMGNLRIEAARRR